MKKFHHLRALALLGALTLYSLLWPIYCCAAKPTWTPPPPLATNDDDEISRVGAPPINNTNPTYQNLMTASEISDKLSTNDKAMEFSNNTPSGNNARAITTDKTTMDHKNLYEIIDNVDTTAISAETMSTSIYELFDLRKGKRKFVSSNQILSRTDRSVHLNSSNNRNDSVSGAKRVKNKTKLSTLERNERSANLSHITGSARKIQLYIKNRFLQLLPDGTVNGTTDDLSDYTILQRTTVNVGQIKIQGVATCLFLCMNSCGTTYGSAEFSDDCIFNEVMEQHHYNTYSSTYHSNAKRKLYLGLNRHGQPRKIQLPAARRLGKLSTYTNSLTQPVAHERVEKLIARLYGPNHVRHGLKQLCDTGKVLGDIIAKGIKNKPKCNNSLTKPNKKKKKRKCREDEPVGDHCIKATSISSSSQQQQQLQNSNSNNNKNSITNVNNKKKVSPNPNQQPKKCGANDDCKSANNNNNKKNKQMKKNNQSKPSQNNSNGGGGSGNNNKFKAKKSKPTKTVTRMTTTPKPDDEIDADMGRDEAFTSDELEDDEEYDEMSMSAAGHSINLVDYHYLDDYSN